MKLDSMGPEVVACNDKKVSLEISMENADVDGVVYNEQNVPDIKVVFISRC